LVNLLKKQDMFVTEKSSSLIKKVCVTGPECTGKSDLSKHLAEHFKTTCVPEYARGYLNKLNHPYQQADLTKIAHGQLRLEDEWLNDSSRVLICDTNLLTIKIWSEFKFGNCDPEIINRMNSRSYHLYLLCNIDLPWEEDPQREHPDKREQLWTIYKNEVTRTGVPFVEISGDRTVRIAKAVEAINALLQ
jgi:NadR type nicotinamide-nucleotide adenylyltransferase